MGEDFNQKKVLELKEEWTNTNILLELLVMWRQLKEMKLIPPKEENRCLELKDTAGYDRMKGLSSLEKNAPEVEDNFDGGTPDCIDCMISAPIEVDLVQQCFVLHELCEKEIEVYSHVPVKDVTVEDLYKSDSTSKQRAMQDKLDQKQGHDFQKIGINLDHKDFKWEISASPKAKTKAQRGTLGATQHTEFQSTLNEPSTEGSMGGTRSTDCQSMFHDSSLKCQQDGGFRCRNDDGTEHNSSQCDSLSQ